MGIRFGHISDMHLPGGSPESEGIRRLLAAGGDPLGNLQAALGELAAEKPDLLLMTGDLCHEGGEEDYADLRELITKYLPGVPVLAALGNHDVRDAYRKGFLGDNYGGSHPYCDTLEKGGYRFIAIDTAWEKQLLGSVGEDQLDWLEAVVRQPVEKGNVLLCHHPFCPALAHTGMAMPPRLERILRGGHFAAVFSGHVHRACTGYAAGILHLTGQSLAFDIEVRGGACHYTTRGGYAMCEVDAEGAFFVDTRVVSPKGVIYQQKSI